MKNLSIVFVFIIQAFLSYGQELKTKKKKVETREGTAHFYVLADNDTVKHGKYIIKGYTGNRILMEGKYINNKKVGFWQEQYYGKEFKGPKASGNYDNDLKIGEWFYFNYDGDTAQIYNWSDNKLVFFKSCGIDIQEYSVIEEGKESKLKLDCPPTCISGLNCFLYEFSKNIGEHSEHFKKLGNELYQLKTKISIVIDKNASIVEISYSTDESKEIKEIIEKVIKSYHWIPGKKDQKYMTTKFEFKVNLSSQF